MAWYAACQRKKKNTRVLSIKRRLVHFFALTGFGPEHGGTSRTHPCLERESARARERAISRSADPGALCPHIPVITIVLSGHAGASIFDNEGAVHSLSSTMTSPHVHGDQHAPHCQIRHLIRGARFKRNPRQSLKRVAAANSPQRH